MNEVKFSAPTKFAIAPKGQLWISHHKESDKLELYIQMSEDENNPDWQRLGNILEEYIIPILQATNLTNLYDPYEIIKFQ